MHLFDRADRFLPNGYCLLPPLQSCDKGNACLTCGVFVTDTTRHFLRGALYFDTAPNEDSLGIVNQFLEKDMDHLINSFRWKTPS